MVHPGKHTQGHYTQAPKVHFITRQKPETKPTHTQWAQKIAGHDEAGRLKGYEEAFVLDFGIRRPVNDPSEISREVTISPGNVADTQKNIIPFTVVLLSSDTINFDRRWNVIMAINSLKKQCSSGSRCATCIPTKHSSSLNLHVFSCAYPLAVKSPNPSQVLCTCYADVQPHSKPLLLEATGGSRLGQTPRLQVLFPGQHCTETMDCECVSKPTILKHQKTNLLNFFF